MMSLQGSQWQPWGCMMHKYTRTDTERSDLKVYFNIS